MSYRVEGFKVMEAKDETEGGSYIVVLASGQREEMLVVGKRWAGMYDIENPAVITFPIGEDRWLIFVYRAHV